MDDNIIKKMMDQADDDDNFLPGIYNYCDRWCERCSFTDECMNYATFLELEQEEPDEIAPSEKTSVLINNIFNDVLSFLKEEAEKAGVDLNEEIDMSNYESARERAHSHPLANRSYEYFRLVDKWIKSRGEFVRGKADEFIQFAELGLDEDKIEDNLHEFHDALEVIQWYFTLIRVKIIRALRTKFYDPLDDPESNKEQYYIQAKVAWLGCQKSLESWRVLYEFLTEDEDKILDILAYLDGLMKDIAKEFPEIETFKRPYFD